ncbi:unnamed protein product [Clavelina lepadiformis]|uniref:Uncharacterized protein n=1 Tax=Clavelina lepadiformis TaxID=159417 RepID=A0ABP0F425_CLALP
MLIHDEDLTRMKSDVSYSSNETSSHGKNCVYYVTKPIQTVVPSGVRLWTSARYCFAYLGFIGFVIMNTLRVDINVAILSMVNASYLVPEDSKNLTDVCPASQIQENRTGKDFNSGQ